LRPPRAVVSEGAKARSAGESRSHFGTTDHRRRDNIRFGRQLDHLV